MKASVFTVSPLLAVLLAGCQDKAEQAEPDRSVKVKTEVVKTEQMVAGNIYSGTIEEENGTPLSFSTAGTVRKLHVRMGQRVAAGQLIAELDPATLQNSYNAAQAALKQAEDAFRRMKELHDKGSLPDIKWVEVQSRVEQARSVEQIAGKNLHDSKLYAPFSGVIAEKQVEVGQNVVPGMPVARLVSPVLLNVKISVPEAEISSLFIGQEASVYVPALDGRAFTAKVTEKGIVAHPLSRSYEVRLRVDDTSGGLLPGMIAEVALSPDSGQTVCLVPANIIQMDEKNREFVWIDSKGRAEKRYVTCGGFVGDGVVVSQGLTAGEHVLVEGQQKVCNGTRLVTVE